MIFSQKTALGELHGRDAIYLDDESHDPENCLLVLKGEVNGALCTESGDDDFIPYTIKFEHVTSFKKTELDEWIESEKPYEDHEISSFYAVNDNLFIFITYDWVFEIASTKYEMLFGNDT